MVERKKPRHGSSCLLDVRFLFTEKDGGYSSLLVKGRYKLMHPVLAWSSWIWWEFSTLFNAKVFARHQQDLALHQCWMISLSYHTKDTCLIPWPVFFLEIGVLWLLLMKKCCDWQCVFCWNWMMERWENLHFLKGCKSHCPWSFSFTRCMYLVSKLVDSKHELEKLWHQLCAKNGTHMLLWIQCIYIYIELR